MAASESSDEKHHTRATAWRKRCDGDGSTALWWNESDITTWFALLGQIVNVATARSPETALRDAIRRQVWMVRGFQNIATFVRTASYTDN